MANPLKMLSLKPTSIQIIQEVQIDAPPAKVWQVVMNAGVWHRYGDGPFKSPKSAIEPKIGGRFAVEGGDGSESRLLGHISHIEPGKLLRVHGSGVMTHLPVTSALIWELQPQKNGKGTLLRFCERSYGLMPAGTKKSHEGGWKMMLGNLKAAVEKGKK